MSPAIHDFPRLQKSQIPRLEVAGRRLYPIMVAEKQLCSLRATLRGPAGHGSLPSAARHGPPRTPPHGTRPVAAARPRHSRRAFNVEAIAAETPPATRIPLRAL